MEGNNSLAWLAIAHSTILFSVEAIAIVTNSILVYLVLTEQAPLYKDYRQVLMLNCLIDYISSFLNILIQPKMAAIQPFKSYITRFGIIFAILKMDLTFFNALKHYEIIDGYWVFILHKPLIYFPENWQIPVVSFYAFANCFAITSSPIQFLFRKCLICDDRKLTNLELLGLTLICFILALLCVLLFSCSFYVSRGKEVQIKGLIESGLIYSNGESLHLLNAEATTIPMLLMNMMIAVLTLLVFVAVIYLSYQIYSKLKTTQNEMSSRTKRMQSQINRVLVILTSLTFIFAISPAPFMIFFGITKITVLGAGTIITIIFACIPVINPICTLFLVGQFRRRFLFMIRTISPLPSASTNQIASIKVRSSQQRSSFLAV